MKLIKYLNAVLTVIAFCLVVICFAITGLIPTASANEPTKKFAAVPVNADGTITVRFSPAETMNVNIEKVGDRRISGGNIDVNVNQVGGYTVYGKIPVEVKK